MAGDETQDGIETVPDSIGRSSSDKAGAAPVERTAAGQPNTSTSPSPASGNPAQGKRLWKRLLIGALG
ncbi:MAG: hypothetical protein WCB94_19885, partial [Terriglobales bacterium]